MKSIKIIILFLLGITTAAFAQFNATQITYKKNTTCGLSFCDAYFEDDSICEISGNGSAFIYKKDGECGIEIIDAEAICSVQCHYYDVIFRQSPRVLFDEEFAVAVVLVLFCVFCVVWWCRRRRSRRIAFQMVETMTNADDDDRKQPSLSVERHDDWDMMGRRNNVSEKKTDSWSDRPMLSRSLGAPLSNDDKTEETLGTQTYQRLSLSHNI